MERTPALQDALGLMARDAVHPVYLVVAVHENGSVEAYAAGDAHSTIRAALLKSAAEAVHAELPRAIHTHRKITQN